MILIGLKDFSLTFENSFVVYGPISMLKATKVAGHWNYLLFSTSSMEGREAQCSWLVQTNSKSSCSTVETCINLYCCSSWQIFPLHLEKSEVPWQKYPCHFSKFSFNKSFKRNDQVQPKWRRGAHFNYLHALMVKQGYS